MTCHNAEQPLPHSSVGNELYRTYSRLALGPVHAVLANSDLLPMIFPAKVDRNYKRRELFRLALVCRKFSTVALDILWNTVYDMEHIYCLFPRHIVYTDPEKTKSFSRTPVTRDEWARFETYAWRIRKLYVSFPEDHDLYMVLGRHPSRRHPFAHLTRLRWASDVSSVSHASLMLCSALADVSFHLFGDGPDDAMADIVQAVKGTCTHLREFKYLQDGEFIPTSTAFETSLASLIRSSIYLRKISVPANYPVLDALAPLPSLTQISLSDPEPESSDGGWDVTYSAGPQSPEQETFATLELLNVSSTFTSMGSFHLFLEPLRKITSKPRVNLNITIDSNDPSSFTELPRQLHDALPPNLKMGLAELCICQDRSPNVSPVYSWQSFSWLLASPRLRTLSLDDLVLEMDDTAFVQMAQKWPKLRVLRLFSPTRPIDQYITFRAMAHLSLLPKLQDLSLTMGPNSTIAPSLLYSKNRSTSPLRRLDLQGEFPDADTLQVALFLTKHFPNLQSIQTLGAQSQWAEVYARMKFLRKVLPEIINGRAWSNSGR